LGVLMILTAQHTKASVMSSQSHRSGDSRPRSRFMPRLKSADSAEDEYVALPG
jgi:hypothetical protein